MSRTQQVSAKLREIPPEKLSTMAIRTAFGIGVAAVGVLAKKFWPQLPDLVAFGTFGFGLVMASGQLMLHPMRLFIAFLRDLLDVIRGKTRDPNTDTTIPPGNAG